MNSSVPAGTVILYVASSLSSVVEPDVFEKLKFTTPSESLSVFTVGLDFMATSTSAAVAVVMLICRFTAAPETESTPT